MDDRYDHVTAQDDEECAICGETIEEGEDALIDRTALNYIHPEHAHEAPEGK